MDYGFKKKFFLILIIAGVTFTMSSCSVSRPCVRINSEQTDIFIRYPEESKECKKFFRKLTKDTDYLENRKLNEIDGFFWKGINGVSIHLFSPKRLIIYIEGNINWFETGKTTLTAPIVGVLNPARNMDIVFGEKTNGLIQSYDQKVDKNFIDLLDHEVDLPKERDVTFKEEDKFFIPLKSKTGEKLFLKTVDRYIFINLHLYMVDRYHSGGFKSPGITKEVSLEGELTLMVGKDKTISEFIQKNNYLPLFPGIYSINPGLYSELRQLKTYPDIYIGTIIKKTEFYDKEEWLSENGQFLERQLISVLEDLAKEAQRLFF